MGQAGEEDAVSKSAAIVPRTPRAPPAPPAPPASQLQSGELSVPVASRQVHFTA